MSRIWMMVAAVWLWAACEPPLPCVGRLGSHGITAMRTEENCKGKASPSYAGGAKVPNTEFAMESVR
jgi:hypothetical protein